MNKQARKMTIATGENGRAVLAFTGITTERPAAPGDVGQFPAVMPDRPHPESTPEEITALDALHFGWNRYTMRRVEQGLSVMGGFAYEPTATERAGLRAWLTATDQRIGHTRYVGDLDPMGFAFVAREVTALDDDALLGRYEARRRELDQGGRYETRAALEIAGEERVRMTEQFAAASDRFDPESKQGAQYAKASESIANGWGYVVWDRINHMYAVALWRNEPEEIAAECGRLNSNHRAHFTEKRLWD